MDMLTNLVKQLASNNPLQKTFNFNNISANFMLSLINIIKLYIHIYHFPN